MKSEHRHELKTNELAEWISHFPQWAKKNLKMIIYISVVVIVVIGLYVWRWYYKNVELVQNQRRLTNLITQLSQSKAQILQAKAQDRDYSIILLQIANNLEFAAQNVIDDQMASLAFIKQAQALRMELHYRPEEPTEQEKTAQINRAKAAYNNAIEKALGNPSLTAMAKFGLGLCEEELGNFELAENIYRQVSTSLDFEGTTAAVQAKQRLDTLDDYQKPVVFKTPSQPAMPEPTPPQIQTKPTDTNLPGQ